MGVGCIPHKTGKGEPAGILGSGKKSSPRTPGGSQSTPWSHLWDWDLASPHLPVDARRWHSCPCSSVMASGTTSASPGPLETACGKHSRMGRSSARGRTWHPGTPSSLGVCSSWGRSRWVPSQACCGGGCASQPPTTQDPLVLPPRPCTVS